MTAEIDEKLKEKAEKNIKEEGYIRAIAMIEALAIDSKAVDSALKKHVEKLCKEPQLLVYKKDFQKSKEVKNPLPNIEKAYSSVVEVEFASKDFEGLIWVAMNYGPSSIEIIEPKEIKVKIGEAQGILNSIADMVHRFAAAGIGGMVVNS